jgi:hypothetical protein
LAIHVKAINEKQVKNQFMQNASFIEPKFKHSIQTNRTIWNKNSHKPTMWIRLFEYANETRNLHPKLINHDPQSSGEALKWKYIFNKDLSSTKPSRTRWDITMSKYLTKCRLRWGNMLLHPIIRNIHLGWPFHRTILLYDPWIFMKHLSSWLVANSLEK